MARDYERYFKIIQKQYHLHVICAVHKCISELWWHTSAPYMNLNTVIMQDDYVGMQLIYVNMQPNHVDMQHKYAC